VLGQLAKVEDRARGQVRDAVEPVHRRDQIARAGVEEDPVGFDSGVVDLKPM
jgi:hypothetical protein